MPTHLSSCTILSRSRLYSIAWPLSTASNLIQNTYGFWQSSTITKGITNISAKRLDKCEIAPLFSFHPYNGPCASGFSKYISTLSDNNINFNINWKIITQEHTRLVLVIERMVSMQERSHVLNPKNKSLDNLTPKSGSSFWNYKHYFHSPITFIYTCIIICRLCLVNILYPLYKYLLLA